MTRTNPFAGVDQLLSGRVRPSVDQVHGAVEGEVIEVGSGTAIFIIPEYDKDQRFGPAPYGRTGTPPQVGDKCLVIFVGAGIDRPWLINWAPA